MRQEAVIKVCYLGEERVIFAHRFEVFLRSSPGGENQPFPDASWNEEERRWEWSCALVKTLLGLSKDLGCPLLIHPMATTEGDLDVLEICDLFDELEPRDGPEVGNPQVGPAAGDRCEGCGRYRPAHKDNRLCTEP